MANWYYYNSNGEKIGPISVTTLKELAQQGTITRKTKIENHVGRAALAGQVNGLTFPEPTPSVESPVAPPISEEVYGFASLPPTEVKPYTASVLSTSQTFGGGLVFPSGPIQRGYCDPGKITRTTVISIVLLLVLNIVAVSGNIMERDVLLKIQAGAYETEEEATAASDKSDAIQALIGLTTVVVFLFSGISFLYWTHRIVKNAHSITSRPLRYSPGWAVGYYFIPILNLIRPLQALADAHRVSKNPGDWAATSGSYLLGWWWASFILSRIAERINTKLAQASMRATEEGFMDAALASNACDTLVNLTIEPISNLLALWVVWILTNSQREAYLQVVQSPPPPMDPGKFTHQLPEENTWLVPSRTSSWAIFAGYAGLLAISIFPAPVALVLGIIALRHIRANPHLEGRGRAIFAIVTGTIFSIPLLLFGILFMLS